MFELPAFAVTEPPKEVYQELIVELSVHVTDPEVGSVLKFWVLLLVVVIDICPHPTFVEKTKHSTSDERTTNKREEKNGGRKKVVVGESKDCFSRSVGWSMDNIFEGLTMQISTETLDFTDNSVLFFCEFTWIQV